MRSFKEKVVFISGGAGGIGAAMAHEFVAAGASVVLADRDVERARAVAAGIDPSKVLAVPLDVTDAASWQTARDATEAVFGAVDILCSNAGVGYTAALDEISLDAWRWVYETNVIGTLHAVQTFLPAMKASGREGHVLITCSIMALRPFATHGAYTSSKAALLNIARVLQLELAGQSIGVSALCPGMVATNLHANAIEARPTGLRPASADNTASPLSNGMAPLAVAHAALEAILANRFHVFTHADYYDAVAADAASMLASMQVSADPAYREPPALVTA